MKPILLNTILAAAWLLGSPGIVLAGPSRAKRDRSLRNPLHFPAATNSRCLRCRYGHPLGGGGNYRKHEGRKDVRQDVGALHRFEH